MEASAQALLQALLDGKSAQAVAVVAGAAPTEPRILEAFTDVSTPTARPSACWASNRKD